MPIVNGKRRLGDTLSQAFRQMVASRIQSFENGSEGLHNRNGTGWVRSGLTESGGGKWSGPANAVERCGAAGSCLGLAEGAAAFANPNFART
jgi:hypothetical protein